MPYKRDFLGEDFLSLTAEQQAQRKMRAKVFRMYEHRDAGLIELISKVAEDNPNVLWELIEDANAYSRYLETLKGSIARMKNSPYPKLKSQVWQFFWEKRNAGELLSKIPYKGLEAFAVAAYNYCDANRISNVDSSVLTATLAKRWLKELQEYFPMHWHSKKKQILIKERLRTSDLFAKPITKHFPDHETMLKYFAEAAAKNVYSIPYKSGQVVIPK